MKQQSLIGFFLITYPITRVMFLTSPVANP
jgi:hypothetical protein